MHNLPVRQMRSQNESICYGRWVLFEYAVRQNKIFKKQRKRNIKDMKEKDFRNITPEVKAEELLAWYMDGAKMDDYAKARACLYACKCAFEITRTHHPSSFDYKVYLS